MPAWEQYGRVDILVNNVGGSAAGGPVALSGDKWDAQVAFNLKSVYLSLQARAARDGSAGQWRHRQYGIDFRHPLDGLGAEVAYAACKAGVIQLSKVVAVEYAKKGIRVNTVVPGQLHTPMVEVRLAGQRSGGDVDRLLEAGSPAFRSASWAMGATPRMPPCSWLRTRRVSLPAPKSWLTAA
ncbi:SDR family NAD(P)-dependent oxidoreductase [Cupriavidus basilensis]